jgi:hypothetical protein
VRPGNGENRSRDKHLAIDKKAIRRARPAEGREYYPQVPLAATENPCLLRRLPAQVAADVPRLERLFAAELRFGHPNGAVDDKASLLGRVASGALRYERLAVRDLSVQPAGGAALVRGTADVRAVGPSGPVDATLTYLAVWTRRDGRWELLAYQSARATP